MKTDLSSSLFLLLIPIKVHPSPLELFKAILHISENLSYTFTTFFESLRVILPSIFTSSELVNHQLYSSLLHLFQSDKNHHLYCYFYSKYLPSSWTYYFSPQSTLHSDFLTLYFIFPMLNFCLSIILPLFHFNLYYF